MATTAVEMKYRRLNLEIAVPSAGARFHDLCVSNKRVCEWARERHDNHSNHNQIYGISYHETESICKEIDKESKGAHEECSRINGTIPQGQKQNLGHVGVAFGQFKDLSLHVQIHQILGRGPRCQHVTLQMSHGVQQLDSIRRDNVRKENGIDTPNQALIIVNRFRKGRNDRNNDCLGKKKKETVREKSKKRKITPRASELPVVD